MALEAITLLWSLSAGEAGSAIGTDGRQGEREEKGDVSSIAGLDWFDKLGTFFFF